MSAAVTQLLRLSSSRQRLVELMRRLRYGRIEHLTVHGGEPELVAHPHRVVREFKFPSQSAPRPDPDGDFLLKDQVVDLFRVFDGLHGNDVTNEVRDSMPFRLFVTDPAD